MSESNKTIVSIPFYVHEGEMARAERMRVRLYVLCMLLLVLLVSTNAAWIIHFIRVMP